MFSRLQIFKDIIGYSSSAIVAQGLGLITGFVVAHWLGPNDYGVLNLVSLVLVYGAYFDLGILPAMARDLPILWGQGNFNQTRAIESTALSSTIISSVLVAVIVIGISLVPGNSALMTEGLIGMALLLVLQRLYGYYITILRGYNEFGKLSQLQILLAFVNTILIVSGVLWLDFTGRIYGAVLAQLIMLIYVVQMRRWEGRFKFDLSIARKLIQVGLPIIASSAALGFLTTIDRIMIGAYLGETQVGFFGISAMVVALVSLIPTMAIQTLYPRIAHKYGESSQRIDSLRDYVLLPSVVLSCLLPLLIGSVYLILPFVIQTLLPEYTPGISAARIVLLGIFFFNLLGLTDYFLVITGKLKQYIFFALLALALNFVLDLFFLSEGWGIVGVALGGTLITYFCYAFTIIGYALYHYTHRVGDWSKFFAKLLVPYGYMLALLTCVEWLISLPASTAIEVSLLALGGQLVLFGLGCLPLVYAASRELKLDLSWSHLAKIKHLV